jgi:hypothetical protein
MRDLKVDVSREVVLTKTIRGVEIKQPTGLHYVDVYFPDGTQQTCGYIGKKLDGPFAPCHAGMKPELAAKIQEKINEAAGHVAGSGPEAPNIIQAKTNELGRKAKGT